MAPTNMFAVGYNMTWQPILHFFLVVVCSHFELAASFHAIAKKLETPPGRVPPPLPRPIED